MSRWDDAEAEFYGQVLPAFVGGLGRKRDDSRSYACPTCSAAAGQPCKNVAGRTMFYSHEARYALRP